MNERFIMELGIVKAVSLEEISATSLALLELGLYKLPYDKVDIQFQFDEIAISQDTGKPFDQKLGPNAAVLFTDVHLEGYGKVYSVWGDKIVEDITYECGDENPQYLAALLITLLATRNIVKTRKENKLLKLGIGKHNGKVKYRYSTTISIPKDLDADPDNHTPGKTKCPHLRRGHIRSQHYGPKNAYIKKIWIQPVFVNADEDFVSTRTHYNMGGFNVQAQP